MEVMTKKGGGGWEAGTVEIMQVSDLTGHCLSYYSTAVKRCHHQDNHGKEII